MKLTAREKNIRDGYGLIAPLMIGYLIFYVIPFMLVIYYSFSKGSVGLVGFANYQDMAENKVFRLAFDNSMRYRMPRRNTIPIHRPNKLTNSI